MVNYKRPIFTQKHYYTIAEVIKENSESQTDREIKAWQFIKLFKEDNKKFKPARFRKYAGV